MKTRAQIYGKEAAAILRDITMYRALTEEQVQHLHPGKREKVANLLAYLVRQGRARYADGLYCAAQAEAESIDQGLLAAVWVLADFMERVEFHSVGDYPAKLIFFADGEIYEIVHAVRGKEALLSRLLSQSGDAPSRYLVLVDHPDQITEWNLPNVSGYCTVSADGQVQYYQRA